METGENHENISHNNLSQYQDPKSRSLNMKLQYFRWTASLDKRQLFQESFKWC
jgi:hypothetical protein